MFFVFIIQGFFCFRGVWAKVLKHFYSRSPYNFKQCRLFKNRQKSQIDTLIKKFLSVLLMFLLDFYNFSWRRKVAYRLSNLRNLIINILRFSFIFRFNWNLKEPQSWCSYKFSRFLVFKGKCLKCQLIPRLLK